MSSLKSQVVKTNTGIKAQGELEEIAEVSEEMKDSLKSVCDQEEPVESFDYWRPEEDDGKERIKERTASLESISKKKLEEESEGFREDISKARKELKSEFKDDEGSNDGGKKSTILKACKRIFRPALSGFLKFIRQTEELIYSKVMLNFNPYYFSAKNFSVSLKEKDGKFEMGFNSPEKEYRQEIRQNFGVGE